MTQIKSDIQSDVQEIIEGLLRVPKRLSPKYFYDTVGSELFEKITQLKEYYPARIEKEILASCIAQLGIDLEGYAIVEMGSGDHSKIQLVFNQIASDVRQTMCYVPVDISSSAVEKSTRALMAEFPELSVRGVVADFMQSITVVDDYSNKLFCFLGSTLGNFDPAQQVEFIQSIDSLMEPGDHFLLGLDMVKESEVLHAAYNDEEAVTEAFNKNILSVVNRTLGIDIDPDMFEHVAFYNCSEQRIEMHLKATEAFVVETAQGVIIDFEQGETIHTENSYKFTQGSIESLLKKTDLVLNTVITDTAEWFSLVHFVKCCS